MLKVRKNQVTKVALVQPANPEYNHVISANGTQEVGHEGEALISANPEHTLVLSVPMVPKQVMRAVIQPAAPEYAGPISANGTR